ncbi:glycoprotein [dermapteran chu-related virus 142]|uniref:Glycoprotein n=1 Tax=dermapteran chu-related virus 142 TaxID=2849726 RepID=A0A7D7F8B3_9VIRU|nr:glycoprotein [dermapteran chu-related virus 142]QMP82300.1 glycoprotein [dermapteran chu-related virus 142]
MKLVFWLVMSLLGMMKSDIIGYDCLEESTNITVLGLEFIRKCQTEQDRPKYHDVYVQIVQKKMKSNIDIMSCLIIKSHFMVSCGMHSHNSLVTEGFGAREIVPINHEDCSVLHRRGYIILNGYRVEGLVAGSIQTRNIVDVGKFSPDGTCQGGSISMKGTWYNNVARQSNYEITLSMSQGVIDLDSNQVVTSNGYRYDYDKGAGFDPQVGYSFWIGPEDQSECSPFRHTVLYEGIGSLVSTSSNVKTLIVNTTEFVFAIELKRPGISCQSNGYITEHPRLLVLTGNPNSFKLKKTTLVSLDVDQFLYTNSKFVYLERHFKGQIESLYQHLYSRICNLKYQQLIQLSSLAYIDPETFAWAYMGKPGVTAIMGGEVVYLMQCKAKPMVYRQSDKCYLEIPVNNSNVVGFLRPRTRIFVRYGTEVPCNPLTPSMFKLGSKWVQLSPNPIPSLEPPMLSADDKDTWTYQPANHLLTSGIYDSSVIQEYSSRLLYPLERSAIQNILGGKSTGQNLDSQDITLQSFITSSFVDQIEKTAAERFWGWYSTLITHASGLVGIFLIVKMVLWIIAFCLNCHALYGAFGFGYELLGALWSVVTKHLLFRHVNTKLGKSRPKEEEELLNVSVKTERTSDEDVQATAPILTFHNKMNIYPELQS